MIFISLAFSIVIKFFSDFKGSGKKKPPARKIAYDVVMSYSVALLASLSLMWFGRI